MSVQPVFLVPHHPAWGSLFAHESQRLAAAVGEALREIHHIGSTAIPGIEAKPIIDLLVVVDDLSRLDERSAALEALDYEVMGEFGIAGRRYFRKNDSAGQRTHQIHAFQAGSPQIQRHLAFRDFMIAHPHFARQYETLKRELAARFPSDIASYAEGKDAFIREMDALAAAWLAERPAG